MKDNLKTFPHVALLLMLVAGITAAGQTAPPHQPPGSPQGNFAQDPIRQLNLTPEQREQIRQIREQNRDERTSINQRVRETNRTLEEVLETESPDENLVEQRLREAGAAQSAAVRLRILTELKIRRVLTPEQRVLLRTLRRHAHEARSERRLRGVEDRQTKEAERSLRMRERRRNGVRPVPNNPPSPPPAP